MMTVKDEMLWDVGQTSKALIQTRTPELSSTTVLLKIRIQNARLPPPVESTPLRNNAMESLNTLFPCNAAYTQQPLLPVVF